MKIYLAGIATYPHLFYKNDCKYCLISFLEKNKIDLKLLKNKLILLDSGAFTYLNSKKDKKIDWNSYINDYADFINKNKIDLFFELDIDPIIGLDNVEILRDKLEKLTQKKCIPVWHKSRGLQYWINMCKNYKYISIGGIVTKEIKANEFKYFNKLLKIAKKYNCKVHGLGFTRTRELHKYKFYSVDSTAWITARFNCYYLFDNKQKIMKHYSKNTNNKKRRVKKIAADKYNEMQINEWVKYQNYAEKNL